VELELRSVLAATDFSEVADRAIPVAFRLAADHGARVTLCHVMEDAELPNPLYAHYHPVPSPEQRQQAEDAARDALAARVPVAYRGRVPHELALERGEPAEEIVARASAAGSDLIVIASHGRRGVVQLVLGSVTQRVVARAPCAVLVVR
jgi:nucleotide-binding universal stress UspA family protein